LGGVGEEWWNLGRFGQKNGASTLFFGTYSHTLDDAGRLTIPSKLRDAIAASGTPSAKPSVIFLTCGAEKCIIAYTERKISEIMADISAKAASPGEVREFKRMFGGEGAMESWDKQGRIIIPEGLKAYAGIRKDVIIVGTVDSFEIWDAGNYQTHREAAKAAYDLIAGKMIS